MLAAGVGGEPDLLGRPAGALGAVADASGGSIGGTFLARPDAWWPEPGVVVEVDSYEWHLSPADADRTRQRHDEMGAAGIIALHFSPRQIRRERPEVVRLIRDALARGPWRPPHPIRTIPCPG